MRRVVQALWPGMCAPVLLVGVLACGKPPLPPPSAPPSAGRDTDSATPAPTPLPTAASATSAAEATTATGAAPLAGALAVTDDAAFRAAVERQLRVGASHDDVRNAAWQHAFGSTLAPEGWEQHAALWRLERAMPPGKRLHAILAIAAQARADRHRAGTLPPQEAPPVRLRHLEKDALQRAVDDALVANDRAALSAALRVVYEEDGQEEISDAVIRIAAADDGRGGEATAAAVAALRLVEAAGWRAPQPVLEQIAALLTSRQGEDVAARRARWQALLTEARALPGRFADGAPAAPRPAVTAALRARAAAIAARQAPAETLLAEVRRALAAEEPAAALWDGLILAAADAADRAGPPTAAGHLPLRLVHALRLVGERAPSGPVRALCLLAAADRLGSALAAAAPPTVAPARPAAIQALPVPDLGELRLRLVFGTHPPGAVAAAVARLEAGAMLMADWREELWTVLVTWPAPTPPYPGHDADAALVERLRSRR